MRPKQHRLNGKFKTISIFLLSFPKTENIYGQQRRNHEKKRNQMQFAFVGKIKIRLCAIYSIERESSCLFYFLPPLEITEINKLTRNVDLLHFFSGVFFFFLFLSLVLASLRLYVFIDLTYFHIYIYFHEFIPTLALAYSESIQILLTWNYYSL